MPFTEHRYTAGDGLSLYYRDYGSPPGSGHKPAVLCLGGLTRNSKDFHKPAERLAGDWRVVCPDWRGRGRSDYDPDPDHYRMETYVDDLRHLLAAAGLHQVVVIGTSMGGIAAMAMAAALPTSLAGVVLNDVGAVVPAAAVAPIIASIRSTHTFASWDEAEAVLRAYWPDPPAQTDEDWRELTRATFAERPDGRIGRDWDPAIADQLEKLPLGDTDLWPYFRALGNIPTGVVRGALSAILTADILGAMVAARPDLIHAEVPGVGHPPNLREQPSRDVIDAILARV